MLQAWIETQLTLYHLDILPQSQPQPQHKQRNFRHNVLFFLCLHMSLTTTRVLNSFEELCITWVAIGNFSWECSTARDGVGSIYIVTHRQTVSLYLNTSVWLDMWDVSIRNIPVETIKSWYLWFRRKLSFYKNC